MIPAGNPLNFTVTFVDATSTPVDPASAIVFEIITPDGTQTSYPYPAHGTKVATGVYQLTVQGAEAGAYRARASGVLSNGFTVTTPDTVETLTGSRFA